MKTKKIVGIKVIDAGSSPDIDSDFNTSVREKVLDYVKNKYGEENVSNIITYSTMAAKGVFKQMCKIYEIPYVEADKISKLIPEPLDGKECSFNDMFNPESDRYAESANFRAATATDEWKNVIEGALRMEGRVKTTGKHACFAGDTLVETESGFKRIDKVEIGDKVRTHTGKLMPVARTIINPPQRLFKLTTNANKSLPVKVTADHPFYVRSFVDTPEDEFDEFVTEPIWKPLSEINPEKDLIGFWSRTKIVWAKIRSIEPTYEIETVYNLSVYDDNSYTANGLIAHNCGVIISSKPLQNTIPLQVDKDGNQITQWPYKHCESLGLIKMDFLGLDTVDLIQESVRNIIKNGKTPPNMVKLIKGKMDDPKVYEMFQKGHTVGIFQFGSPLVRDLLLRMKPTEFNDLVACTAVARPGPMGEKSHEHYADRKNGLEEMTPIHPDFKGSVLEEILQKTYNLVIYQEQVMQIANRVAGMTLQEGDDLRKAMGKKKIEIMMAMKPKFIAGGQANGFSKESMEKLWDVLEPFAKYAFNRSHSVAYAMNAYQAAYLKAHYPTEFMSALISQTLSNRDKTLNYLRESKRMKLKMGHVNVNLSDVKIAPDFSGKSDFDILFGFSGIKGVSDTVAQMIVDERNANGPFKSVQDFFSRCAVSGIINKTALGNLTLAGAFDSLEPNRKKIFESIPELLKETKKNQAIGDNLFGDLNEIEETAPKMVETDDYSFTERLRLEADVAGLYISAHPLDNIEFSPSSYTINDLLKSSKRVEAKILAVVSGMEEKKNKRSRNYILQLDDKTGFLTAKVAANVMDQIDKLEAQRNIERLYERGERKVDETIRKKALKAKTKTLETIEPNKAYFFTITFSPSFNTSGSYYATVSNIEPVTFSNNGSLPLRVKLTVEKGNRNHMRNLYQQAQNKLKKFSGKHDLLIGFYDLEKPNMSRDAYIKFLINHMKVDDSKERNLPSVNEVLQIAEDKKINLGKDITVPADEYVFDYKLMDYKVSKDAEMMSFVALELLNPEEYDNGFKQ